MGLLDLKIVVVAVLSAALVLFFRSFTDLASTASFSMTAPQIHRSSPSFSSYTMAPSSLVGSEATANIAADTTAASTTTTANAGSSSIESGKKSVYAAQQPPVVKAAASLLKVHKLCVMSRVHNQPRSLAEWLEYHAALGITRFFLVDDCSTDGGRTRTVMDVYRQEGLVKYYTADDVTRMRCTHVIQESPAEAERAEERRRHRICHGSKEDTHTINADAAGFDQRMAGCAYMCGGVDGGQHRPNEMMLFDFMYQQATTLPDERCEWLMVFDTDEYMTFATDLFSTPDVPAYIADYEKRTNGFPILRFPWVIMGSGGQEQRPPGLLVDNFKKGTFPKWMLKTAGKVDFLETWRFSHWPAVKHVSRNTSVADYGFEIPARFVDLKEFTNRNWLVEQPGKGTELRTRNVSRAGGSSNETVECLYPNYGVFLKHHVWRSFEEFKAHRSQKRVKSDGQHDVKAMEDPHAAWLPSTHPNFDNPCSESYFNDFTALLADKTRAKMAARRMLWNERHQAKASATADDDYELWIKDGACGVGPEVYSGPFPPVEDWMIR